MVTWASASSSPSPLSLPPLFHLSTSTLQLSLVLALQSAPTKGAPLIEAPNDPRHCFLGQKTRGQGSRGPVHYIPAQPHYRVRLCRLCTAQGTACGDHRSHHRRGQFVYLL